MSHTVSKGRNGWQLDGLTFKKHSSLHLADINNYRPFCTAQMHSIIEQGDYPCASKLGQWQPRAIY